MDFENCRLEPLKKDTMLKIIEWEYDVPYADYSFKGRKNGYLADEGTWGTEQFCLMSDDELYGYVTCQFNMSVMWVGWALAPEYCGGGGGHRFVSKCVSELKRIKNYDGGVYLRVAEWNRRAIKAYEKAGFLHIMTIQDELAYTGRMEDFWVMAALD